MNRKQRRAAAKTSQGPTNIGELSAAHQQAIQAMLPQLLIALVRRDGGQVSVTADEINAIGALNLSMKVTANRTFHFEVVPKIQTGGEQ